jgi:hypothetical protein
MQLAKLTHSRQWAKQAVARQLTRHLESDKLHSGWQDVNKLRRAMVNDAAWQTWTGDDERHPHAAFVQAELAHTPSIPEHLAVIGDEDDERVLGLANLLDLIQDLTDEVVDVSTQGIVSHGREPSLVGV